MKVNRKWTRAIGALFGAGLLLAASPAMAAGEAVEAKTEVSTEGVVDASVGATGELPEGADLASLEVVKVQPVMFNSTDTMAAVDAVMTSASAATDSSEVTSTVSGVPPISSASAVTRSVRRAAQ